MVMQAVLKPVGAYRSQGRIALILFMSKSGVKKRSFSFGLLIFDTKPESPQFVNAALSSCDSYHNCMFTLTLHCPNEIGFEDDQCLQLTVAQHLVRLRDLLEPRACLVFGSWITCCMPEMKTNAW
jgi:hypothetical protein